MFILQLDLVLRYMPLMSEYGRGVVLTREIKLPFPPWNGLEIFSREFDECPAPGGMPIKDVVWDVDRGVFLARTMLDDAGSPLPLLPALIRSWIDRGWRFGSYADTYPDPYAESDEEDRQESEHDGSAGDAETAIEHDEDWDEYDRARLLSWRRRSAKTNRVFRALIRHMAETYDNESVAFAFDKTGRYFTESEVLERRREDREVDKFAGAVREFQSMPLKEQEKWRRRTLRYPSLEALIREGE